MIDLSGVLAPKGGRDIDVITNDILDAKRVGGEAILTIGRCLEEAKRVLPHGEWLPWLTEKVDFSERSANRFMRLAREWSNPTTLSDLGASKALSLLALPAEERERFLSESHTVGDQKKEVIDMSARELEKAIRERKEALSAAEKAGADAKAAEEARDKLAEELKLARNLLDGAKTEAGQAGDRVRELEDQLEQLKQAPVEVAVMEVDQAKLDEAAAKARAEMEDKLARAKEGQKKAKEKQQAAEEARDLYQGRVEELERKLKQAAISADQDVAAFQVLFQQTQENVNKMRGLLIKARGREDQGTAQSLEKALRALGEVVGRCVE